MKLLGCHIDNFGAFHNYDLTFNDGLNVIMQANGWGKTTLAVFVKAMLYGFEGKRVRNVAENERLRYKPWQGGKYGGSLDFEADGREYRVLRTFGATGARDTFKIVDIDTGKSALSDTGEDVGEWLFGLDANAFQKSVFVVQNGFGFDGSTAGLRNRLNSLVNEADDVSGFDKAQAKLDERRKFYKKTGNRGAIADVSKDIAKLVDEDARADGRIAELRRMGAEIAGYASSIETLDERIAETQSLAEKDQAAVQQEQALLKVGAQLKQRREDAKAAYEEAASGGTGKVPTADAVNEARQSILELSRLEKEATDAQSAAKAATENRMAIAGKYPSGIPGRQTLLDMRDKIAGIASQEAALAAAEPDVDEGFERLQAAISADPGLVERSNEAASKLEGAIAAIAAGRAAESELATTRAQWGEKRKRLARLADESKEKMAAVPADAGEQAESLRKGARDLREASASITKIEARCEALESQLAEEKAKLDALPGGQGADASDIEALETAAKAAGAAADVANRARSKRDEEAAKLPSLKQAAETAQEKVDEQRAAAAQAKPGSPAPAIACFAIAAAAIIIGVVMGPAGPVSFGLYGVGAALAIVGAVLLSKRKPAAPAEPDAGTLQAAADAKAAYESAKAEADRAESELSSAEADARRCAAELAALAGKLFPGEVFDDATIAAQVPVLKQRMTARSDQEKKVASASEKLDAANAELAEARKRADEIAARHAEVPDGSYDAKAAAMEARASELSALEKDAAGARQHMVAAIAEEMGVDAGSVDGGRMQSFLMTLQQEEPPEAGELAAKEQAAKEKSGAYASELNGLLASFGLPAVGVDDLAVGVERLKKAIDAYREGDARAKAAKQKASARETALASAKAEVTAWAASVGAQGMEALTDEWFARVDADIAADEKAAWEEKRAKEKAEAAQRSAANLRAQMGSFFAGYGIERPEDMAAELDGLAKRAGAIADLKKAAEMAEAELAAWLTENRKVVETASARAKNPQAQNDAARQLGFLRQQRDALVSDKAQREEQRNAILESLEGRLAVQQELELLSKKKQAATANLFTIQKTSELLQRAREGLDGRYLGDLADRFGDYANAWLEGEEIEAAVDSDFGVALYDGDSAHDVAGYSTGYQDLLDICFRMALIDTVFQAEPPFLIMDDPFTSLDEEKIRRAFLLLETLSSKYQVIYFTCHPSRMEAGEAAEGSAAFVLPEQHARRELPRARAKREAEERAKAQAELVASYAVVPVTGGRASIVPAGRRSINSNLINVEFVLDESGGSRDNSFEVHFIDGKGRVLCDRQTVEVIGGRIVPDRVRFSLATRDDSGATYDMIIHEDGREPAELAARIPYKAEVSFATDDFGF